MHSGHSPTRRFRLLLVLAAGGLSIPFTGCKQNGYDEQLTYPVRSDYLVKDATAAWEFGPSTFNRPGMLPLETINLPAPERSEDANKLKELVGKKILSVATFSAEDRAQYGKNLAEMFGTPAHPKVSGFDPAALKAVNDALTGDEVIKTLKLDEATLAAGSSLYRMQCLHCHGLEGNGRGPTGPWVNPPPRDYRSGIFKFTSSNQVPTLRKPRREDLLHILAFGIEGTSMPSFNMLSIDEREKIASYVMHLSIRGEVEYQTMLGQIEVSGDSKGAVDQPHFKAPNRDDLKNPTMKQAMEDNLATAANNWVTAQKPESAIVPEPYPYGNSDEDFIKSAARGGKVFMGTGGCIQCHQNFGRESNLSYDAWGTIVRGRNVYDGVYRGGRRAVDLYNRIHMGINGSGMTSYKDIKTLINPQDLGMTADEFAKTDPLWDIVNFLRAVSHRDLREKLRAEPFKLNLAD